MKTKIASPKKRAVGKRVPAGPATTKLDSLAPLIAEVRQLIQSARRGVASVVDTFQVMTNFEIGRRIVEHEQKGERRAAYGTEMLKELSTRLTEEFGRGFSRPNLEYMRKFYLLWRDRAPLISREPARGSAFPEIRQKPSDKLAISQTASGKSDRPFTISWSHYVELIPIKDPDERSFYEIEAANSGWSVPELRRQKASSLYQRLALSRDQAGIKRLAREGQLITRPEDLFKEPLVLEFLGLEERARYSESDLESAIITHFETFLLELGKGFLFEARQKRFTFDGDHYFLDLVFYNRLLRCYVVIDLKLDKLTHQDLGQMQIHPVRYRHALRLRSPKSRRRQFLRRLHKRPQTPVRRARAGKSPLYTATATHRACLLRGLPQPGRCDQTGKISQDRLGQTLHQNSSQHLSHGVNVNYYDREVKLPEENPTVGLILCKEKKDAVVKLTLPKDANIHAKEYQLYLPSKELLEAKLLEWTRAEEARRA